MPESSPAFSWLPPAGFRILLVLFLSFLVGLEREEHGAGDAHFGFGGVRTFPLIGLVGYAMAVVSPGDPWAVALGFLGISGFLLLSYWHQLKTATVTGVTSEMSALATYLVGALVAHDEFWIATTVSVASMILLELKNVLEGLARRIAPDDILSFTKFLLLTAVILPIVPDRDFTPYAINPFRTWLIVVAVSAISYGSYVIQKLLRGRGSLMLTAVLGGAYSSTLTTIVLARRAAHDGRDALVCGSILMASGMMYLRLALLVVLFDAQLVPRLVPAFVLLAAAGLAGGWLWSRRGAAGDATPAAEPSPTNPLELRAALAFALLFVAMLVAGHFAAAYLGRGGIYGLATIMGVTDVDPFILSMTQVIPGSPAAPFAANAILIAAASNNVVKGIYAAVLAPAGIGHRSLQLLLALAAAGLVPLLI